VISASRFSIFLIAVLVIFYWPFLTGQQSFYVSDCTYYFEPFTRFMVDRLRHGQWPLWNPYLYCGMAQTAVPSPGMFYLPAATFVPLSFSRALAIYMIFHQLIAGAGAFLLVVALGWGAPAAAVAGLGCALTGYMFSLTTNYTLVASAAWVPLLVWAAKKITCDLKIANLGFVFLSALIMCMMVTAGRPEISVPGAVVVFVYTCVSALNGFRQKTDGTVRQLFLRLAALLLGGLMAMPVILPALEWVKLSPRAHGLDLRWVLLWSANWYDCLSLLFAQPLGDLTYLGSQYLNLVASRLSAIPYLSSPFVGTIIFTLALWALFDKQWHWRLWVVLVFAGTLALALGNLTPAAPLLAKSSPILASFRYPVKLLIFPIFCLCLMAARGMSLACEKKVSQAAQITTGCLWFAMLILGIAFVTVPELSKLTLHFPWYAHHTVDLKAMRSAQSLFGQSFIAGSSLALGMQAAYLLGTREKSVALWFPLILPLVLAMSLLWPAAQFLRHGTAGNYFDRPSELSVQARALTSTSTPSAVSENGSETSKGGTSSPLADGWKSTPNGAKIVRRFLTLYFDPLTPPDDFLHKQHLDFQHGFYLYARLSMLPNCNLDFGVPYSFGYEAAEVGSFKELFSSSLSMSSQNRQAQLVQSDLPMARFCKITSTGYMLTQVFREKAKAVPQADPNYFAMLVNDAKANVRIYKCLQSMPRAYFAEKIHWAADTSQFSSKMLDKSSTWMVDETWVETDAQPKVLEAQPDTGESIRFERDDPESIRLRTVSGQNHLLVLTDQYYPGWTAAVDGAPVPIYRVNSFCRGVIVPSGEHSVSFTYQSEPLRWGLITATAVLLLFASGFAWFLLSKQSSAAKLD
jgi:hypothetical protein